MTTNIRTMASTLPSIKMNSKNGSIRDRMNAKLVNKVMSIILILVSTLAAGHWGVAVLAATAIPAERVRGSP